MNDLTFTQAGVITAAGAAAMYLAVQNHYLEPKTGLKIGVGIAAASLGVVVIKEIADSAEELAIAASIIGVIGLGVFFFL